MLREKPGNVVVLSGRNRGKIDSVLASVDAGLNVLVDKPWLIEAADFPKLERALATRVAKRPRRLRHHDRALRDHERLAARPGAVRAARRDDRPWQRGRARARAGERPPPDEDGGGLREPAPRLVLRHPRAGRGPGRRGLAPRRPRGVEPAAGAGGRLQGGHPPAEGASLADRARPRPAAAADRREGAAEGAGLRDGPGPSRVHGQRRGHVHAARAARAGEGALELRGPGGRRRHARRGAARTAAPGSRSYRAP